MIFLLCMTCFVLMYHMNIVLRVVLYMWFVGCLVSAGICGARLSALRVLHAGGQRPQPGSCGTDP